MLSIFEGATYGERVSWSNDSDAEEKLIEVVPPKIYVPVARV